MSDKQLADEAEPPHVSFTSSSQAPDGRVHVTAWLQGHDPGDPVTLSLTPRQALAIIQQLATTLHGMTR